MRAVDELLEQQLRTFHGEMETMAGQYKRRCAERMVNTMEQQLEQLTKPPTRSKRLLTDIRHWSSRQLMALAKRIDPLKPGMEEGANKTADIIDAECTVIEPDKPARSKKKKKLRLPSSAQCVKSTAAGNDHSSEEGEINL